LKLIKAEPGRLQIHLAPREKEVLFQVLSFYPMIPPGHQKLSKASASTGSEQVLLEEALAEVRAQNKKQLQSLINQPDRLKPTEQGWCLTLKETDFDWLLQVLNDVRVGSWIALGCQENLSPTLTAENASFYWTMEAAGYFQMRFLELLERGQRH
jgi:hypothetical protein